MGRMCMINFVKWSCEQKQLFEEIWSRFSILKQLNLSKLKTIHYPKCVSLFFGDVGPIFCNLASLGDNFQKLNIINFLYWFWTFKMMEHHRKFNFQTYLSKYFSKNWFCIPSSNFTRLALDCPLHAPFHFTHLTFWS